MTSHLGALALFAALVSIVVGALYRETPREEMRMAGRVFAALVGGAYALGWILYIAFR